ncbi:MAG TPA: fructosamine kinase family protein [Methyloprofundus sp.]|nr:fructosamine kinase family protein [Methyloprofundus sp.]HIL79491.1 fructosamine kinase family protein [Methylococcales bacterium]
MQAWQAVIRQIEQATEENFNCQKVIAMHGGDINQVYQLQGAEKSYFVKLNRAELLVMFEVEALGLQELAQTKTLRIPETICYGINGSHAFLVLEYVALKSANSTTQRQLGKQLVQLHQTRQDYFGWHHDNFIGSHTQKNTRAGDWVTFWQNQRLQAQLQMAADNGYTGKVQQLGEQLYHYIPDFFSSYQPQASLLHGDLWSGNAASDSSGHAIIYDPACYYGDREADIAMTELFGGFGTDFYAAYNEHWALDADYKARKTLYNLYHILNHLNLFGSGYLRQAEAMMQQLISECS